MVIFLKNRYDITPDEFLARCAMYAVDPRRRGNRVWIYSVRTARSREGLSVTPMEMVNFVATEYLTEKGNPILHFIADRTDDQVVDVAFTSEGKEWRDNYLAWQRQNGRRLPKRWTAPRRSHHAKHINRGPR